MPTCGTWDRRVSSAVSSSQPDCDGHADHSQYKGDQAPAPFPSSPYLWRVTGERRAPADLTADVKNVESILVRLTPPPSHNT